MYSFACKDMGMDCNFVTTGNTVAEVTQKAMAHAQKAHAEVLKSMSAAQMAEMNSALNKAIKPVAA